ncbi:MAG: M20 family metallo-hydrolase [Spirochaetaceae bacterium]|jgi:succinyl-diaminopimelate desuccinylase|nr:M20 family metallo-hydrolase [Spirochaetaceae bacterium]
MRQQSNKKQLIDFIEKQAALAVELETLLTAIPAVSPVSGGEGELKKCEALEVFLRAHGINNLERVDIKDKNAAGGIRPNLIATLEGGDDDAARLWIMSHLDVVPPGELKLWQSDPWKLVEKDGKIFGRGVEDNQQGLCSSVIAALSFVAAGIRPARTLKLLFVADEECGSDYGIDALIKLDEKARGCGGKTIFRMGDYAVIPDGGDRLGETIEIAEKHLCWVKFTTHGRQTHGSRPDEGINAFLAASALVIRLCTGLYSMFNAKDSLFEPSYSTFEPSKKEANVENINTIPGEDVFYFDMRILPVYSVAQVMDAAGKIVREIEAEYGVSVESKIVQSVESRPTPDGAPVVTRLAAAVEEVLGVKPRPVGIGGGTVGAFLRNAGIDAAVWSKMEDTAHNPNESAIVSNILDGAKVMALMAL